MRCSRELAQKEGIFVGITAGRDVCRRAAGLRGSAAKGATVLCMLPDTGERYLSTPLFADIPADMTEGRSADLRLDAERAAQTARILSRSRSVSPVNRERMGAAGYWRKLDDA